MRMEDNFWAITFVNLLFALFTLAITVILVHAITTTIVATAPITFAELPTSDYLLALVIATTGQMFGFYAGAKFMAADE
jgi:hypothetical protein